MDSVCRVPLPWSIAVHAIDTGNHQPICTPPYRLCPAWCQQVKEEEISSLLSAGIIESCVSPWSSPIVPIKNPDGSIRLCIDYRKVNSVTTPDPFYMPSIDNILDNVGECKYLSKLNLSKDFYQVPIKESDKDKTAFCTSFGKFRFLRMPFGLMNAPSTFQRMMQKVLEGQENYSSPYIEDVLIYSRTWKEHVEHIRQVLGKLKEHGLTAKPTKCVWGASRLEYLGFVVGVGKVAVPEARVKVLREFKKPKTKKDMRSFLGTIGYYRRLYLNLLTKPTAKLDKSDDKDST